MTGWDFIWGVWFGAFVALELLAVFGLVPWQTLSDTCWGIEGLADWIKIVVLAGLCVLTVHIVFRWP